MIRVGSVWSFTDGGGEPEPPAVVGQTTVMAAWRLTRGFETAAGLVMLGWNALRSIRPLT
jgi:hypothetical protein